MVLFGKLCEFTAGGKQARSAPPLFLLPLSPACRGPQLGSSWVPPSFPATFDLPGGAVASSRDPPPASPGVSPLAPPTGYPVQAAFLPETLQCFCVSCGLPALAGPGDHPLSSLILCAHQLASETVLVLCPSNVAGTLISGIYGEHGAKFPLIAGTKAGAVHRIMMLTLSRSIPMQRACTSQPRLAQVLPPLISVHLFEGRSLRKQHVFLRFSCRGKRVEKRERENSSHPFPPAETE